MDLRSQLEDRKKKLKATRTLVTTQQGERYEVIDGIERKLTEKCLPFVVDDKPDLQVAKVIDGLFLSSQDPVASEELLKMYSIKNVLSLGICSPVKFEGISYYFVDFYDLPEFDILIPLRKCLGIIDHCRNNNVLVHCNAGVSRSATVVIAYIMANMELTYDEAYQRVKRIRNCIKPNDGFVRQLKGLTGLKDMLNNFVTEQLNKN